MQKAQLVKSSYDHLHQEVQKWIWHQGWQNLRPIQQRSITPIFEGKDDVIITANTAGGKTEAAYLPILSNLLSSPSKIRGFEVLSISPLKALINDQQRRLEDMTRDMGIDVTAWHGDISASRKQTAMRNPSGILIITPESLEAMLALRSEWAREAFASLKYVVIDELHAFMDSERGVQLQSLLSRLQRLTNRSTPRIALSATISDIELAKQFLRPDHSKKCEVISDSDSSFSVQISLKEFIANEKLDPKEAITNDLFMRLRGNNNLVFTNSRKDAEAYMLSLEEKSKEEHVPCEFCLHHGSLSRFDRKVVEKELQKGNKPVTAICTASMELGVDIGPVASVAQIGVATSPEALRQRLGRSGRRGAPAVLRIYSIDEQRDDYKYHLRTSLVQNIAAIQLMNRKEQANPSNVIDNANIGYVSIAVQQLMSMLAQYGSFYASESYDLLCGKDAPFSFLSTDDFGNLLKSMHEKKLIAQLSTGQIVVAEQGEHLLHQLDFFSAFTTPPDYVIIDRATNQTIGNVQYKPYYGEVFILAGRRWIVDAVEDRSSIVYASATPTTGKMMFEGSGIEASAKLTNMMREIYASDSQYPYLDPNTAAPQHLDAARQWFHRRDLAAQRWLAQNDGQAFFTWAGMKANRALALMANSILGIKINYDHLALHDLSPENIAALSSQFCDIPLDELGEKLSEEVPRIKKEKGKFDQYLPDSLLNRQYAASRLDLPAAIKVLRSAV